MERILPLMLVIGVLAISTAAVFIKLCLAEGAPPEVVAAARLSIAAVLLGGWHAARNGAAALMPPRRSRGLLILAGVFLGLHFFCWITSLAHTSVLSSVVIVTTNPIFVGIASLFLFKERLHPRLIAAILLAAAGGGLIAQADAAQDRGTMYGNLMALFGAMAASSYFLVGRHVRRELDTLTYTVPVYAVAALVLCAIVVLKGRPVLGYSTKTYVLFVLLAVVPQLIGHGVLNWALRYLSATTVAVFILGEPIGSAILAFFVFGEGVKPMQAAGGALILAGIVAASLIPRPIAANPPKDAARP